MPRKKPATSSDNTVIQVERTKEQDKLALRREVHLFYDFQTLRIQTAGRTYARPGTSEILLHPLDVEGLKNRASDLEKLEALALGDIKARLKKFGFFRDILSDKTLFKGIGPTMSGVILAEFDINKAETPSQFWSFAGLAPVPASRCLKCHSVVEAQSSDVPTGETGYKHKLERSRTPHPTTGTTLPEKPGLPKCPKAKDVLTSQDVYVSGQTMRRVKGEKLKYNEWLKTKMVGVLAPVLLQVNSPWRKYYDDYKNRKINAGWGRSDAHRHQAALRYMIKMLLLDIWRRWREYEGLPICDSYAEAYLGHGHGQHAGALNAGPPPDPMAAEIAAEVALAQ